MSKVYFDDGQSQPIQEKLARLTKETEVNVHVGEKIYYEASFKKADFEIGTADFIIDRFYKHGGKKITLSFDEITDLDLPVTVNNIEGEDE